MIDVKKCFQYSAEIILRRKNGTNPAVCNRYEKGFAPSRLVSFVNLVYLEDVDIAATDHSLLLSTC